MKAIALLFFVIAIGGCATHSIYGPTKGSNAGYKEIALADNHYRVQFKINGSARNIAQKYALLRAAELTLAQGYDWFVVEQRKFQTLNEPEDFGLSNRPIVTRNCGLLGCKTSTQFPEQAIDIPATETTAMVEIRMGRGVRPEKESYDAREMWESQHIK